MMSTNEHDLRMAQHLQNTLAVNNINDFDPNSQDQHHSRSQNNKNYRTPTSTPSFSNQNKQLVKTGYEEVSHPVGFKHNVKRSFFYLEMNQLCFNCYIYLSLCYYLFKLNYSLLHLFFSFEIKHEIFPNI
jgi:hypothetical protein